MTRRAHFAWTTSTLATLTSLGSAALGAPWWLIVAVLAVLTVALALLITEAAITAVIRLRASNRITTSHDALRVLELHSERPPTERARSS